MKFPQIFILLTLVATLTLPFHDAKAQSEETVAFTNMRTILHDNLVIYQDKSSPTTNGNSAFYIYIVKPKNGSPYLMCSIQYSGATPLYVSSYILKPNKNNPYTFFNITPYKIEKWSDVRPTYSNFCSWCNILVGENLINALQEIVKSENPKLMYIGSMDNVERKISKKEVSAIVNVLAAYDSLK